MLAIVLALAWGMSVYLGVASLQDAVTSRRGIGRLRIDAEVITPEPVMLGRPDPQMRRLGALAGLPAGQIEGWARRRLWFAIAGGLAGLGLAAIAGGPLLTTAPGLGAWAGWHGPRLLLRRMAMRRQSLLLRELPAFLERFVLGNDAGLHVRQALRLAAARTGGPLGDLARRVVQRLDLGDGLVEAIRCELDTVAPGPVRLVLAAMARGEQLGASLVDLSREQAAFARQLVFYDTQRTVEALPLKLTICAVVFLFPPLVVLLLVPSLLAFLQSGW